MKIKEHLILRRVGEKYMIIDPDQGMVDLTHVYALNETAAWLWEQLRGIDFTSEVIANLLESHYKIDASRARSDADLLLSSLGDNHLLEEDDKQHVGK